MPTLLALGNAWHGGVVTVAGEHFVSAAVQRRLAAAFDAAPGQRRRPRVVVGLARGSRHELGVLAFAVALRRAGLEVVYVGGDLPAETWVVTATGQAPAGSGDRGAGFRRHPGGPRHRRGAGRRAARAAGLPRRRPPGGRRRHRRAAGAPASARPRPRSPAAWASYRPHAVLGSRACGSPSSATPASGSSTTATPSSSTPAASPSPRRSTVPTRCWSPTSTPTTTSPPTSRAPARRCSPSTPWPGGSVTRRPTSPSG